MRNHLFIVSDVHLGARFCKGEDFMAFLDILPDDADLVLNGDTVTHMHRNLTDLHMQILERLRSESEKRDVVLMIGNHDPFYKYENTGKIRFLDKLILDDRILIEHGHKADWVRKIFLPIIYLFHYSFKCAQALGAKPQPTSSIAKRLTFLFRNYTNIFLNSAARRCKRFECDTVIFGHIHFAEDRFIKGVRYLNAGCWLDYPISYVEIQEGKCELKQFKGIVDDER
ncbi:hypothetical protein BVX97_06015 [bacterium E08(2017)]|nr:hypothetical protein BVX97_06015 [bacterium E08(2017)]